MARLPMSRFRYHTTTAFNLCRKCTIRGFVDISDLCDACRAKVPADCSHPNTYVDVTKDLQFIRTCRDCFRILETYGDRREAGGKPTLNPWRRDGPVSGGESP